MSNSIKKCYEYIFFIIFLLNCTSLHIIIYGTNNIQNTYRKHYFLSFNLQKLPSISSLVVYSGLYYPYYDCNYSGCYYLYEPLKLTLYREGCGVGLGFLF